MHVQHVLFRRRVAAVLCAGPAGLRAGRRDLERQHLAYPAHAGYRVQGRGEDGERLLHDAKALETAGAFSVVLECVPAPLAVRVTESLSIPTIGIGAGAGCDAQVLVWQDMAGLSPRVAKFVKKYADLAGELRRAATEFAQDVTSGAFPSEEYSYR